MIRRIKIIETNGNKRVRYPLDKKMIQNLGWLDNDEVIQIPFGLQNIMLFNNSYNLRLKNSHNFKDFKILNEIGLMSVERQKKYLSINKKYKNPNSRAFKVKMAKFNRGLLTEDEAINPKKISVKRLKQLIKYHNHQISIHKSECDYYNELLNSKRKK